MVLARCQDAFSLQAEITVALLLTELSDYIYSLIRRSALLRHVMISVRVMNVARLESNARAERSSA